MIPPSQRSKRTGTIGRDKQGRIAPFEPTPGQRYVVERLAAAGHTQDAILQAVPWGRPDGLPISGETLRKHFRAELDHGSAIASAKLKRKAFDMAMAGDPTMLIFLLKTLCGYREPVAVEKPEGAGTPPAVGGVALYVQAKDAPAGASPREGAHNSPVRHGCGCSAVPSDGVTEPPGSAVAPASALPKGRTADW